MPSSDERIVVAVDKRSGHDNQCFSIFEDNIITVMPNTLEEEDELCAALFGRVRKEAQEPLLDVILESLFRGEFPAGRIARRNMVLKFRPLRQR
jgi:hypothetical protein